MSDLHHRLLLYLMVEYHVSVHMIATASNSTTAESFLDSCLLCTSPKYYHISAERLLCLTFAAVRYLFVMQCCHPSVRGRGGAISILI